MHTHQQPTTPALDLASQSLLYITDLVNDSVETLAYACELADRNGVDIEVIHVIDVERSASNPDAQMGIQYRLEALAGRLRSLKKRVASKLLFGSAENVIAKRAMAVQAKLVAFGASDSSSAGLLQNLVQRIRQRVSCPVVIVPHQALPSQRAASRNYRALLDSSEWLVGKKPAPKGSF